MKKILIIASIFLASFGGYFGYQSLGAPIVPEFQEIKWIRPLTDDQWKEDVKNEQLNHRLDFQLEDMRVNLSEKIVKHKTDLDRLVDCPDCFKYPLRQEGLKIA